MPRALAGSAGGRSVAPAPGPPAGVGLALPTRGLPADRLFLPQGVLDLADDALGLAFGLLPLAFGGGPAVATGFPNGLLDASRTFLTSASNAILVHPRSLLSIDEEKQPTLPPGGGTAASPSSPAPACYLTRHP